MPAKPNDRPEAASGSDGDVRPEIYVIIDGEKFPRPGLETFFAKPGQDQKQEDQNGCSCHPVIGIFCSCNKVCTCQAVPVGVTQPGGCKPVGGCRPVGTVPAPTPPCPGDGSIICRCAPVH